MCFSSGGGDGGDAKRRREEAERQARIKKGNQSIDNTFSAFGDEFYDQQQKNYLDYANPQLTDQFQEASKELVLALADQGLLNSSTAAETFGKLDKKKGLWERQIADKARNFRNQSQGKVEDARSELQNQNMNLANPSLIASRAASRAESLNQLPVYEPLLELFADATEGLATQAALERRGKARYDTGLFSNPSSTRIVS